MIILEQTFFYKIKELNSFNAVYYKIANKGILQGIKSIIRIRAK